MAIQAVLSHAGTWHSGLAGQQCLLLLLLLQLL
jgi:hypothetical protein